MVDDDAVEAREDVRRRPVNGDLVLSESLSLFKVQCCCMRERFKRRVARAGKCALKMEKNRKNKINQCYKKGNCIEKGIVK